MPNSNSPQSKSALASLIFLSRWLQAPLYFGLIVTQAVYVYRFILELWHLIDFGLLGGALATGSACVDFVHCASFAPTNEQPA